MNENIEIERKFLVLDDTYKQVAVNHSRIIQGYISRENGNTVRVRIRQEENGSGRATLTIKSRPLANGFSHFEWEKEIPLSDGYALMAICQRPVIDKTRWLIPATTPSPQAQDLQLVWEVDEFHGSMSPLVMAEIELPNEQQPFNSPPWIGREVTYDSHFHNANMTDFAHLGLTQ